MTPSLPAPLGLKKSFGYGDRLGLATPGHVAANNKFGFAPIFAQQSIRELQRTARTPAEILAAARAGLIATRFSGAWGADADHLKKPEDALAMAQAGFTFFTIDPSDYVRDGVEHLDKSELTREIELQIADGIFDSPQWADTYLGQFFEISSGKALCFSTESLLRAAAKYGRAIAYCVRMAETLAEATEGRPYEIEVSVDETESPTSPLEHLFFGLELKRRGVQVVSLAPRFPGELEKGIDYRGDLELFESAAETHAAIARFCGPYKLSLHSGSDKFSIYPILGRICGDLLHVKTSGTSYLEGLRVICRVSPRLFRQIAEFSVTRFPQDRATYALSTTDAEVAALRRASEKELEQVFLNERAGRQLLHVTFGSVLSQGRTENGSLFEELIFELLREHADLHAELLEEHFTRHLQLLSAG